MRPPYDMPAPRYAWHKMDTAIITVSVKNLPQLNRMRNADDIETYLDRLYEALNHFTNTAIPLAKLKRHAAHW